MPKTKHHKKKYPHSEWVRRRNIRKLQSKVASKLDSLGKKAVTVDLLKSTEKTRSLSQTKKQKGWWAEMKNAFVGRRKNTKDAV